MILKDFVFRKNQIPNVISIGKAGCGKVLQIKAAETICRKTVTVSHSNIMKEIQKR